MIYLVSELLQGIGGTIQYPHGYLQKAYEIARENGGLCVADEVSEGSLVYDPHDQEIG